MDSTEHTQFIQGDIQKESYRELTECPESLIQAEVVQLSSAFNEELTWPESTSHESKSSVQNKVQQS